MRNCSDEWEVGRGQHQLVTAALDEMLTMKMIIMMIIMMIKILMIMNF